MGSYTVDFFCASARLVLELDGDSHAFRKRHDARRTAYLESRGMQVLRFDNDQIHQHLERVLDVIYDVCIKRQKIFDADGTMGGRLRTPAPRPSP